MSLEKYERIIDGLKRDINFYNYKYGGVNYVLRERDANNIKFCIMSYIEIKTKIIIEKYCEI